LLQSRSSKSTGTISSSSKQSRFPNTTLLIFRRRSTYAKAIQKWKSISELVRISESGDILSSVVVVASTVASHYPCFHDSHRPITLQIKTLLARVIEQERYDSARKTEKAARMDPEEQAMLAEACRPAPCLYSFFSCLEHLSAVLSPLSCL
jgi:hypothetical protein